MYLLDFVRKSTIENTAQILVMPLDGISLVKIILQYVTNINVCMKALSQVRHSCVAATSVYDRRRCRYKEYKLSQRGRAMLRLCQSVVSFSLQQKSTSSAVLLLLRRLQIYHCVQLNAALFYFMTYFRLNTVSGVKERHEASP